MFRGLIAVSRRIVLLEGGSSLILRPSSPNGKVKMAPILKRVSGFGLEFAGPVTLIHTSSADCGYSHVEKTSRKLSKDRRTIGNEEIETLVNSSVNFKNMQLLGIDLSPFLLSARARPLVQKLKNLDFESEVLPYLEFLCANGVPKVGFAKILIHSKIFEKRAVEELQEIVNHLKTKGIQEANNLARILTGSKHVLGRNVAYIDQRWELLRKTYKLSDSEICHALIKTPKLLTRNWETLEKKRLLLKDEFGFTEEEIKSLILDYGKYIQHTDKILTRNFKYLIENMKVEKYLIANHGYSLYSRINDLEKRHRFLLKLGRAEYSPQPEGYISLQTMFELTDEKFCETVDNITIEEYQKFVDSIEIE